MLANWPHRAYHAGYTMPADRAADLLRWAELLVAALDERRTA